MPALQDPFRKRLLPDWNKIPENMLGLAEPCRGEPAFDPALIKKLGNKLSLPPDTAFEHPSLGPAVRIGLAHIFATFQGNHPKYGVDGYAEPQHDGFPPTIVAVIDALTTWLMNEPAVKFMDYWLDTFVKEDGTIDYYGTSLSEYGQLLYTAYLLDGRTDGSWSMRDNPKVRRLAAYALEVASCEGLPKGVPEADEADERATYFHNAAWLARGLVAMNLAFGSEYHKTGLALRRRLLAAIREAWPRGVDWLRPTVEPAPAPQSGITSTRLGSYTNYRYWPELLSSEALPHPTMRRIVQARLNRGGQHLGMTRFGEHLDDWPLMDYLHGIWRLGLQADYRISVYGHLFYDQAEGHLTAYEQVTFPPGRMVQPYCLPSQLIVPRAAIMLRR